LRIDRALLVYQTRQTGLVLWKYLASLFANYNHHMGSDTAAAQPSST
jgi:hypothetical protein